MPDEPRLTGVAITWRTPLLLAGLFAAILVPFLLLGARIDSHVADELTRAAGHPGWIAVLVVALLAADPVLPVPSSVLSTGAGVFLGFPAGCAASFAGMMGGALLGFAIGRRSRPLAWRYVGDNERRRVVAALDRYGDWLVVASRPVPMIAESVAIVIGMGPMRLGRYLWLSACGSAGVSAAYAAVGAYAMSVNSFLLAFAAAILLPLGPIVWARRNLTRPARATSS